MKVFKVEHVYIDNRQEEVKFIGIFSTREKAKKAISKLIKQPGFKMWPEILSECPDKEGSGGFIISACVIDCIEWAEGFIGWEED